MLNCSWQVLVVRRDLKMTTGKIASQCARKYLRFSTLHMFNSLHLILISVRDSLSQPQHVILRNILLNHLMNISFTNMQMLPLVHMQNWCKGDYEWFLLIQWILSRVIYLITSFIISNAITVYIHCSHRSLLRQWEQYGQPKIVVTCKNQQEM